MTRGSERGRVVVWCVDPFTAHGGRLRGGGQDRWQWPVGFGAGWSGGPGVPGGGVDGQGPVWIEVPGPARCLMLEPVVVRQ